MLGFKKRQSLEDLFGPSDSPEVLELIIGLPHRIASRELVGADLLTIADQYPLSHNLRLALISAAGDLGLTETARRLLVEGAVLYPDSPPMLRTFLNAFGTELGEEARQTLARRAEANMAVLD